MNNYDWAVNKVKLATAIQQLNDEKIADPKVEVNEATIKERYIKLAGLVRDTGEKAKDSSKAKK